MIVRVNSAEGQKDYLLPDGFVQLGTELRSILLAELANKR
jgi:hypothetical protein